jgi:hypothetical protein
VWRAERGFSGNGMRHPSERLYTPQRGELFPVLVYRGEHSNAGLEFIEVFT